MSYSDSTVFRIRYSNKERTRWLERDLGNSGHCSCPDESAAVGSGLSLYWNEFL